MAQQPYRVNGLGLIKGYADDQDYLTQTGSTPRRGDIYFNTSKLIFRLFDGSQWADFGPRRTRAIVRLFDDVLTAAPSGPQVIDGVPTNPGDLVLLSIEATVPGVYQVEAGTWTLQAELSLPNGIPLIGDLVAIQEGTVYALQSKLFDGANWISAEISPGTVIGSTLRWDGSSYVENPTVLTDNGVVRTVDNADADAIKAADIFLRAGNKTAGTGDGGDLNLNSGTSFGGTRGSVILNASKFWINATSATDPLVGNAGEIYYNTVISKFKYYNGTQWIVVGSGSGGVVKARLHDGVATTVTSGAAIVSPYVVDGVTVANGDRVLFSNLVSGDNQIYVATIAGPVISWAAALDFDGFAAPATGDLCMIQEGAGFAVQIGKFDGTDWVFNDKVRYFNGLDYWEQSNLNSVALNNNQVVAADIFAVTAAGSENMVIQYSIMRGTIKEAGILILTNNGTTTSLVEMAGSTSLAGIVFTADINAGNVRLRYTSDNSGSAATIKFIVSRWSDSAGGPGGLPSYSAGGSGLTGGGSVMQIAIFNGASSLTGNANFTIDTANGTLSLGSGATELQLTTLAAHAVPSGVFSDTTIFQFPDTFRFAFIEYSVDRGTGNYRAGTLIVTQDGSNVSVVDIFTEVGTSGLSFATPGVTHSISGGFVNIAATSSGGVGGTLKKAMRRWA